MADFCSIKDSLKCQMLSEMSGISKDSVALICGEYLDLYGRYPELDEIPNTDSSSYLKLRFDIKSSKNGTLYQNTLMILDITGNETIEEANASINDVHRDLEVKINDIDGVSIFEIKSRPSEYKVGNTPFTITANNLNLKQCGIISLLDKMRRYYGINIIPITSDDTFEGLNVSLSKAFIYQGNIYVNIDNASVDSPIHEMLHILIGSMSRHNPQLFYSLVESVEQLPDFKERAKYFPNRTRSDIDEEIFVEELGKYLTNQKSLFSDLDENVINQIFYYIERDLDTILDGNYSVKSLDEVFNNSLLELAELTESNIFNIENGGSLNSSTIHRMLSNIKENYLKTGELTENCE